LDVEVGVGDIGLWEMGTDSVSRGLNSGVEEMRCGERGRDSKIKYV
jgi:hypothetical protein